ncbi:MAG: hypothetical protein H0T88_03405, partial [Lysobacter sp.]|nr:hypothetical protein [Lysobacter sp.]
MADDRPGDSASKPMLEWVSAAVGLMLTLAMLGFLGWKAIKGTHEAPPAITIDTGEITPVGSGYVVEIVARNQSGSAATSV